MQQEDDLDYNKYIIKNLVKMAAIKGPNIITDGLVLALDAASIRSFRGEPTTNLANTDTSRTLIRHDSGASVTFSDAPEKGDGWKKITINTRGSNFRIARFPYISHPTSTIRTYSVEVDFGTTSGYYVRIDGFAGGANTFSSGRIFTTFTTTTNNGSLALFINHNTISTSGLNDVIYYRYYQVENMPYPTAFTEGIRGTTVATGGGIADLTGTGNHGELVNGPTFSSSNGGSIVFDGVDDFVSIPNITMGNGNLVWTISAWTKTTTTVNALGQGSIISNASGGPVYSMLGVNNGKIVYWTYQNNAWSQKLGVGTVNDNTWHLLTWVNNTNSTMAMYVDGNLDTTVANSTSGNNNPLNRIGGSWAGRYSGFISNLLIYKNKSLTAGEVFQNYNATRRRFGL